MSPVSFRFDSAPRITASRYGSEPLLLKPGKYPVYAQVGELKSGVEEVEIIPAARLQLRKSSRVTDKKREYAAEDPRRGDSRVADWVTEKSRKR